MKPEIVEDIGDWRGRFGHIAATATRGVPQPPKITMRCGKARRLLRCIDWYDVDHCGLTRAQRH